MVIESKYLSSPLKWAGSKAKVLPTLLPILNKYKKDIFCEPFVGAANVSLNFDAKAYHWNDLNKDLIKTYDVLLETPKTYIDMCNSLFEIGFDEYYKLRDVFNKNEYQGVKLNKILRTALFQYLNKHGFNGLCRYNKKGEFNVPIGTSSKPKSVPIEQINGFVNKFNTFPCRVHLSHMRFEECFDVYEQYSDALIYSDPPYVPLTSDFNYTGEGFNWEQQVLLKELSKKSKHTCIISNHWTELTKELYSDADEIHVFDVQRTISCKGSERKRVQECIVVYK